MATKEQIKEEANRIAESQWLEQQWLFLWKAYQELSRLPGDIQREVFVTALENTVEELK